MSIFEVVRRQLHIKLFSDIFPTGKEKLFDVQLNNAIIYTYSCINNKPYLTFLLDTSVCLV